MLKATYRFFDNDHIAPEEILDSHIDATCHHISNLASVLAIQDTTELNFSHHLTTEDIGPISGANQAGLLAHTTLVVTKERVPLGVIGQQVWARDENDIGKKARRKTTPIRIKLASSPDFTLVFDAERRVEHSDADVCIPIHRERRNEHLTGFMEVTRSHAPAWECGFGRSASFMRMVNLDLTIQAERMCQSLY